MLEVAFARPSLRMRLAKFAFGLLPAPFPEAAVMREKLARRAPPEAAPIPAALRKACAVSESVFEGSRVITLAPLGGGSGTQLLYLHGGGYINPLHAVHWGLLKALCRASGATITVPLYPLAPEHDHRPGTALVLALCHRLRADHPDARIVVGGDSAGGNFALGTALRLREAGEQMPDGLLLYSPWLDLTMTDARASTVESADIMLRVELLRICGTMWAGDADPAAPPLSPLHANLAGLPPVAIFQGTADVLSVDARSFAKRAEREGHPVDYFEYAGAFHDFMIAGFTREAQHCIARSAAFLGAR